MLICVVSMPKLAAKSVCFPDFCFFIVASYFRWVVVYSSSTEPSSVAASSKASTCSAGNPATDASDDA
mgnify:CR=1 FL=1